MDQIAADLRESKLKQKSLGKAYQSVHALASVLASSPQWEDLEGQLESTRGSIEARFGELERREAEIGARSAQLDAKESDFNSKADELRGLEDLLEQKLKEVMNCKNHLHSLQSLIREHSHEVLVQDKRLGTVEGFVREKEREREFVEAQIKERVRTLKSVEEKAKLAAHLSEVRKELELKEELTRAAQRSIEECDKELISKEEKLGSIRRSLAECCDELESKERRVREIESKEKDFVLVKKSLEEWSRELELKQREMGVKEAELESKEERVGQVQKSIRDGEMHLDAMSKGLQKKESELADQARELALKEEEFASIKKATEERSENLESKERQLEDRGKEIELKHKEFARIKLERRILTFRENKLEVKAKELESKQTEFDSVKKSTEEQAQNLNAKERQLEDQAKELDVKQQELDSVIKSAEEQIRSLKENERQLEVQAKDLELKQKELDSMKQSLEEQAINLKSKENTNILLSQVKVEPLEHIPSNHVVNHCSTKLDSRSLQLFMNKHLKGIDSASSEITVRLQASTDPAKLVLDAMQGFYPSDVTADNMECDFDLGIIRRSCIVLLETLKRVSPQINLQVKEEAMKLSRDWKAKMKTEPENWLEILGFLRLVTIYDIASAYDTKELQSLIATVGENGATELSQAVGCTEMKCTSIVCSLVTTEKAESSLDKDAATASQNLQLTVDQQEQKKNVASMVEQKEPLEAISSSVQQSEVIKPPSMVVQQKQQQSKDPSFSSSGAKSSTNFEEDEEAKQVQQKARSNQKCYKCQGYGHFAAQCPTRDLKRTQVVVKENLVPNADQRELNKVEQHGKKRRWDRVPVHQNKFQRTSRSAAITYAMPIHTDNQHERYAYLGQYAARGPAQHFTYFGMPGACNYGAGVSAPRYGS